MKMQVFGNKRENERECEKKRERERQPVWVLCLLRRSSEIYRQRQAISSHRRAFATKTTGAGLAATSTTSESLESYALDTEIPAAARRPRNTRGSQKWSNVRAVMALYSSLRKIKRYSRHQSIWTVTSSTVIRTQKHTCTLSQTLFRIVLGTWHDGLNSILYSHLLSPVYFLGTLFLKILRVSLFFNILMLFFK